MRARMWLGVCGVLVLGGGGRAGEPHIFQQLHMGTLWTLKLYEEDAGKARAAAAAAFARVAEIDGLMSDWDARSELSQLSRSSGGGRVVTVSKDVFSILGQSTAAARESEGAFDITLGPAVSLWREAKKSGALPSRASLAEARAASGWEHIELTSGEGVLLKKPRMRLDLGGIAKGWAQDAAVKVIVDHGLAAALVDAGGGIRVLGAPPARDAWKVALKPFELEAPAVIMALSDAAVATSGDLHQSVQIGGVSYSHIIDPRTGLGMTVSTQASVIAPTGAAADWLATALCVMGPEAGIAWMGRTHPEAEAMVSQVVGPAKYLTKETKGFRNRIARSP